MTQENYIKILIIIYKYTPIKSGVLLKLEVDEKHVMTSLINYLKNIDINNALNNCYDNQFRD